MRLNDDAVTRAPATASAPVVLIADFGDAAWVRRLTNAIGDRAQVHSATRETVIAAATRIAPLAVILPVVDAHGAPAAPIIRRLLERMPDTDLMLSVPLRGGVGPHVLSAARAGGARFAYEDDGFPRTIREYVDDRVAGVAPTEPSAPPADRRGARRRRHRANM